MRIFFAWPWLELIELIALDVLRHNHEEQKLIHKGGSSRAGACPSFTPGKPQFGSSKSLQCKKSQIRENGELEDEGDHVGDVLVYVGVTIPPGEPCFRRCSLTYWKSWCAPKSNQREMGCHPGFGVP